MKNRLKTLPITQKEYDRLVHVCEQLAEVDEMGMYVPESAVTRAIEKLHPGLSYEDSIMLFLDLYYDVNEGPE